jgi:hypothetical protein
MEENANVLSIMLLLSSFNIQRAIWQTRFKRLPFGIHSGAEVFQKRFLKSLAISRVHPTTKRTSLSLGKIVKNTTKPYKHVLDLVRESGLKLKRKCTMQCFHSEKKKISFSITRNFLFFRIYPQNILQNWQIYLVIKIKSLVLKHIMFIYSG